MLKILSALNPFYTNEGEEQKSEEQHTKANVPLSTGLQSTPLPVTSTVSLSQPGATEYVKEFVARFQKLIEEKDQPGFDFKEFTESLFENSPDPSPDLYRIVFNTAKKAGATVSNLLESAKYYKNLVETSAGSVLATGEQKKSELIQAKQTESQQLTSDLGKINKRIGELETEITNLRGESASKSNQLSSIDQKYKGSLDEIELKVAALNEAKLLVINSFVDVETGITNNIK